MAEQEKKGIDPKYLKGLRFNYSEAKEEKGEDGRKVRKYIPKDRPLRPEDVLAFKEHPDHVVIVTADGRKLTVQK